RHFSLVSVFVGLALTTSALADESSCFRLRPIPQEDLQGAVSNGAGASVAAATSPEEAQAKEETLDNEFKTLLGARPTEICFQEKQGPGFTPQSYYDIRLFIGPEQIARMRSDEAGVNMKDGAVIRSFLISEFSSGESEGHGQHTSNSIEIVLHTKVSPE